MSYGQDLFPIITTKKIHVSTSSKKIKVDFCLNLPNTSQTRTGLASILDLLYFHFIVLDDSNIGLLTNFKDPALRESAIKSILRGETQQRGRVFLTLGEVLSIEDPTRYTETDFSNDYRNEIRASVEIGYNTEEEYEDLETNNLHLVCFAHTRVTTNAEPDGSTGGANIAYDLMLSRTTDDSILSVPEFVDIFYVRDPGASSEYGSVSGDSLLQPYFGPVHHRADDDPDPTGYVGWSAGSRANPGPRLEVRKIRNYKTSSDLAIAKTQTTIDASGQAQSFVGHNHALLSPVSNLRSALRHNSAIKSAEDLTNNLLTHAREHCLKRPNIVDYNSSPEAFINLISDVEITKALEESHYGCVTGINFLDTVRHRSRLGYVLDFHHRLGNEEIVSECIYKSNIKNINISRRRVTNRPHEINERQSKKYTKYEKNSQDVYIVSSSDKKVDEKSTDFKNKLKHRLFHAKSERGSLEEVELITLKSRDASGRNITQSGPKYSRQFIISDYDLFHNINYGKYTYVVDLILNDGIYDMIESLYRSSKEALSEYEKFLFEAKIPMKIIPERQTVTGNYDYYSRSFVGSFKVDPKNEYTVLGLIEHFRKIKTLISGNKKEEIQDEMTDLKRLLDLNSAKLEDLGEFAEIMAEMINSLKLILSAGVTVGYDSQRNTEKSAVSTAGVGLIKSITVSSPLGVYAHAFSNETLLSDYAPPGLKNDTSMKIKAYSKLIKKRLSDSGNLQLLPNRFITIDCASSEEGGKESVSIAEKKGTANKKQKNKRSKNRRRNRPAAVREVSTIAEYNMLPTITKANINLKLSYLFNSQQDFSGPSTGEVDKPPSYYPHAIQRYQGGITLGLSRGGTILNSLDYDVLSRGLEFTDTDLSDEIKKEICDSIYIAKDKDHFIEEVERKYEDLVKTRDLLGAFYETVHSSMNLKNKIYERISYNTSYFDMFEGTVPPQPRDVRPRDPYQTQSAHFEIILPGHRGIHMSDFNIAAPPNLNARPGIKRLICVSCRPPADASSPPPVNNVMFLEV